MPEIRPTERELEALKVLWSRGKATVREVYGVLHPRDGSLAYTTVLSLMQTMEQKGLVGHEAVGKTYHYYSLVEEAGVLRGLAAGFLERVFNGALGEYVARALETRRPSAAELDRLEQLIAEARRGRGPARKRKGGA